MPISQKSENGTLSPLKSSVELFEFSSSASLKSNNFVKSVIKKIFKIEEITTMPKPKVNYLGLIMEKPE